MKLALAAKMPSSGGISWHAISGIGSHGSGIAQLVLAAAAAMAAGIAKRK